MNLSKLASMLVFVGTYTRKESHVDGRGKGIYLLEYTPSRNELVLLDVFRGMINPSYLVLGRYGQFVYVANEHWFELGPEGTVSSFKFNASDKTLEFINMQPSKGLAPCYVCPDHFNRFLFAANYQTGHFVSYPILDDGAIGDPIDEIRHDGSGPHPNQDGPHGHAILPDPENRHVLAIDLGTDRIYIFRLDHEGGKLTPSDPPFYHVARGDGPRHFTFHPNGRFAYAIHELSSTIQAFIYDCEHGRLNGIQRISTLPAGFQGENSCADIHISPSGRHLYGSNRGHNSIVHYMIDDQTGKLALVNFIPSLGKTPRNFVIDPSGAYMFVANQDSDNIVLYRIDPGTGSLSVLQSEFEIPSPVCLKILEQK